VVDKEYIYKTIMELSAEEVARLEALDPEELGIETMPQPNFGGYGGEGGGPDETPDQGGAYGNQGGGAYSKPQGEQRELEIPEDESDESFVRRMREALDLNISEPIGEGELKLARMVREVQNTFGNISVDEETFAGVLRRARFSSNGHGP
jgi:hypothetical protein